MAAKVAIRKAVVADYDQLCELFAELDKLHHDALPHVFCVPSAPLRSLDYVASVVADSDAVVLVAEFDGRIVGAIHVTLREASEFPVFVDRRYAWVENLGVRREFRRRGIATELMRRAQDWARARGVTQCELNVWEFNEEALEFYASLGYETASRRLWKKIR